MQNEELAKLEGLVGTWKLTLTDAWFLESREVKINGSAEIGWLDDALLRFRWTMDDDERSWSVFVIGRSDPQDRYVALANDYRGVARLFDMTFDGREWVMSRADPDFHQRIVATVEPDRILMQPEASEDEGATWRKDFDLIFERV